MRRLLKDGQVGLVGGTKLSRLGQGAGGVLSFHHDCLAHPGVVWVVGKMSYQREPVDLLPTIFAMFDRQRRTERMTELAFAQRGLVPVSGGGSIARGRTQSDGAKYQ